MTSDELRQIKAALNMEIEKHLNIDSDLFYFILEEIGERPMSTVKFSRSKLGPLWKSSQLGFTSILEGIIKGNNYKRVQIVALKKFMAILLLDDMKDQGIPINIRSVCHALGSFGKIFDRAFPGYRKNQLGPLIMAKLGGSDYGYGNED
jgi:hypothetical protein